VIRLSRIPDARVVLAGVLSLILLGPLRGLFDAVPLVLFLAALVLFMAPGMLVSLWFLREYVSGAILVPVSFAIGTGLFGLLGVPFLITHQTLGLYIWISGAIVVAFLIAGAVVALRRKQPVESKDTPADVLALSLWVPFLLMSGALALVSRIKVPSIYDDIWIYLSYVRDFMGSGRLAVHEPYFGQSTGVSRAEINGWLLEHAALSQVSGIDPVKLVLWYLNPTLVIVSMLAFYALARTLFKSEAAALLAGCLYALFFLAQMSPSILPFGGEFVARLVEDKFATKYIFLPVALITAVAFLESRKFRWVALFAFMCWSAVAVHPVGLAIIGLSMAGFGILYLAVNWRERDAWIKIASLGLSGLTVLLLPLLYVLTTGESFAELLKNADINSGDPDILANMVFVKSYRKEIFELGGGLFIMHPSLLLNPAILAGFVPGVPFLLWRLKKSLAAQLLLGTLLLVTIVCYVPQISTFVGNNIVIPGQLWRLAWPIPLAALLTVSWMVWEAMVFLRRGPEDNLGRFLPVALVALLIVAVSPAAVAEAQEIYHANRVLPKDEALGFDPIFGWMRDNIHKTSIVLAPDAENTVIPAYSASANVVSRRGELVLSVLPALRSRAPGKIDVPQGSLDVRAFYASPEIGEKKIELMRKYKVDYVMTLAGSPLDRQLKPLKGITAVSTPGERYALYAVDLKELGLRK